MAFLADITVLRVYQKDIEKHKKTQCDCSYRIFSHHDIYLKRRNYNKSNEVYDKPYAMNRFTDNLKYLYICP